MEESWYPGVLLTERASPNEADANWNHTLRIGTCSNSTSHFSLHVQVQPLWRIVSRNAATGHLSASPGENAFAKRHHPGPRERSAAYAESAHRTRFGEQRHTLTTRFQPRFRSPRTCWNGPRAVPCSRRSQPGYLISNRLFLTGQTPQSPHEATP